MSDLRWIAGCGFRIGPDGDLDDTAGRPEEELLELVRTRLEASEEGWQLYPGLGAGLTSLLGRAASEEVALLAERMAISSLTDLLPQGAVSAAAAVSGGRITVEIFIAGRAAGLAEVSRDGVRFVPGSLS